MGDDQIACFDSEVTMPQALMTSNFEIVDQESKYFFVKNRKSLVQEVACLPRCPEFHEIKPSEFVSLSLRNNKKELALRLNLSEDFADYD